jgi:AcrR family transcriptional regulator
MSEAQSSEAYQTRVGALRRERTRNRLIESALGVFAQKGPDAPVIDDFIAAAGVARGTFYNYFRTTGELLAAVAGDTSDEVLGVIDPVVQEVKDPAQRVVIGVYTCKWQPGIRCGALSSRALAPSVGRAAGFLTNI